MCVPAPPSSIRLDGPYTDGRTLGEGVQRIPSVGSCTLSRGESRNIRRRSGVRRPASAGRGPVAPKVHGAGVRISSFFFSYWLKSNRGLRASRSDGARSWHQRPWRAQPRARRAAWALLARPGHVGSMAASSADDHLTVGGDADVVVGADPEHAGMYHQRLRLSSDC